MKSLPFFPLVLLLADVAIMPVAGQISYGLVPAMVTEEFTPGRPLTTLLQISNGTDAPVMMRGVAMDLWYDDQNGKIFAPPGTKPRSASDWIEFVPKVITVPPKQNAQVTLVITPPPDAQGGYYSVAFLETKPELAEPAQGGKQALFTNVRLGALVLLTARGTGKYALDVTDVAVTPPSPSEPLSVSIVAHNSGNVHLFPMLSMMVFDSSGKVRTKARGEVKRMLPGQSERISVTSAEVFEPGDYEVLLNMVFGSVQTLTRSVSFRVTRPLQRSPETEVKTIGVPF